MAVDVHIVKDLGDFHLNVSFSAGNEVVALLGASGCGKSMTLRSIAGIIRPDAGRISVDGTPFFDSAKKVNLRPQARHVGFLFQNYALFPHMSVLDNIASGVRKRCGRRKKRAQAEEYIARFHLDGLAERLPGELSGGQQQRAALARILIGEPRILLLDEPFSALDTSLKWEMELELRRILESFPGTAILVSHSREEVYRLADHVCVIEDGVSRPMQTVRELFDAPVTEAAARLTGCKNLVPFTLYGEKAVYVPQWGIILQSATKVPTRARVIGIRRHYVRPAQAPGDNTFSCRVEQVIEDVFSIIVRLRPEGAAEDAPLLESEMEKITWAALRLHEGDMLRVAIAPKDLLLLQ